MTDSLIKNLRDLATFAHADLSVADEAADEIERLREALREYVATVVCEEGVAFIDRMPTAELRLLVESVSKEDK